MLLNLAIQYIKKRPLQYIMTIIVVAVSISLTVAVMLVSLSLKEGMISAAMPFDMIVGAKGSSTQLVLNTIFLQDTPVGNVDRTLYEELQQDERAAQIIPFAFGDNYEGYKIVGSDENLFTLRPGADEPYIFELAEGNYYREDYQAVIGSDVANSLGLKVGDTFEAVHGFLHNPMMAEGHEEHEKPYTVVGILKPMYRPYDMGIFTTIETVWEMHGEEEGDVTALMVTPHNYVGLMQMYQEMNNNTAVQAAFPGEVLGNVFSIMGQSEEILTLISYMVVIIGLLTIVITLYWSVLNRKRDHATLRAIGANRRVIFTLIIIESFLIMIVSGILGLAIGHVISFCMGNYMREISYIYSPVVFDFREVLVFLMYTMIGLAGSILPAFGAYRQDVAKNLAAV